MEFLTLCPLCKHNGFLEFLKSQDYFLTKEEFKIVQCSKCGLKYLNPRPDEKEISFYYESPDYISHDSHPQNIHNYLYSKVRNYTRRKKLNLVEEHSKGRKILDIGCGTGEFISYCKELGWDVTGVEPNPKPREYAIRMNHVNVLDEAGLEKIVNPSFDVITLWHVLEHIHLLDERMLKISQILNELGTLIIAVPNSNSWDANYYNKFWAAYDLPRHLYHFSQNTIKQLAHNFGFEIVQIVPMKFDAFYISLMSEKYVKGYRNYFMALLNGVRSNNFAKKSKMEYSSLIFILKSKKPKIKPSNEFQ